MSEKTNPGSLFLAACVGTAALLAGCATEPSIDTSPEAEVTFDGLYEVKGTRADKAWARPNSDIDQYSKIKLVGAGISYRPGGESSRHYNPRNVGEYFEVTEEQKERFEALVAEKFREELGKSKHYELVEESGPDVLLVKGALIDVVSYIPPDAPGRVDVYLSAVGEATLVLEISDSMTETVLARAVDRRVAEDSMNFTKSNRAMNTAEVRRMVSAWASTLRDRLDSFKERAE